jgi:hypothetical protein
MTENQPLLIALREANGYLKRIAEQLEADGRVEDARARFNLRMMVKDFGRFAPPQTGNPTDQGTT